MFPFIKSIEILIGIMLLANIFVPLALTIIFPILVGISLIHLFLNPAGIPMMLLLHALHGFLIYAYWYHFKAVVVMKATTPGV